MTDSPGAGTSIRAMHADPRLHHANDPKIPATGLHCLPSQDTTACLQRGSAPACDVHLCPEKGESRGAGGAGAGRCSLVAQSFKRTSEVQAQHCGQWGAAGQLLPLHIPTHKLRTGQPSSTALSPAHPCPSGCPGLAGTVGRCALLQKELVGERKSWTITVWKVSPGSLVK